MKRDIEAVILTIAAVALLVPVLRYALAFQQAEPVLEVYGLRLDVSPITGLAFGLSYEAAAFVGIRAAFAARRRSLRAWWWPLAGSVVQTVAGTVIVVPVLVAELRGLALAGLLGALGAWLWCAVLATATLLTFATLSLALAVQPQKRSMSEARAASMPEVVRFMCDRCGREFATVQARSAHERFCQRVRQEAGHAD